LVDSSAIWGSPGQFVDVFMLNDGASYDSFVVHAEIHQTLAIIVDLTLAMPPHSPFTI